MKQKLQKFKKNNLKQKCFKKKSLKFGLLGLKALESGTVNKQHIKIFKQSIIKKTNKKIKIWTRINHYLFTTKKSLGIRMGKGKGKIESLIYKITNGSIIFELSGPKNFNALNFHKLKFPLKLGIFLPVTKFW